MIIHYDGNASRYFIVLSLGIYVVCCF